MKAMVLGCGLVGELIAKDLEKDSLFQVSVANIDQQKLNKITKNSKIVGIKTNLSNPDEIKKLVVEQDIVVGAVPGFLGFNMLRSVIEAGKNIVDISFMAEDALSLDQIAREKGVTAVVDMGISPGMSHMLGGYADSLLDET